MSVISSDTRTRASLRACAGVLATSCLLLLAAAAAADEQSYTLFESGQVRPLAISPDGNTLFACNTPDNRLEIFTIGTGTLTRVGSVPVGLEPVAVAARNNGEVWVVNHVSDSVSIVDVSNPAAARVTRTLLVGDEPSDVVFAGPGGNRAFITTAHRGQNTPLHSTIVTELRTEGIGRADVWVFDATNLGSSLGGTPLTQVVLFGDTPRALAVSPDGSQVYAAVFHSGNQTTALSEGVVPNSGPTGLPPPTTNFQGIAGPAVGLIVKWNGSAWLDERGVNWNSSVRFSLPDHDVFVINANANPPVQVGGSAGRYVGVGTVLFNMAVNPVSGKVYVSNTEAVNEVRFEGPGIYAAGFKPVGEPATVRGHLHESRITVLDGSSVVPRHLNKHIDYDSCCAPIPNAENADSLAFPIAMEVSSDGQTLYVSAFGSSKVGVFDTAQLEANTFVPDDADQLDVPGGGPTGLALDESRSQLYVLTRFDNSVAILSTATGMQLASVPLHNPEPASVVNGRPFLYEAAFTSSHGDSACASCHVFGNLDSLAWDLGNPDDTVLTNPGPFTLGPIGNADFHPMKGPMTTQSLRGMANHGPMHWRGDRTGGNDAGSSQPDSGTFNEDAAFKKFNPAFEGLLGRDDLLTAAEMQAFTDFILQVMYPPNPIRNLDNTLTTEQSNGQTFYFGPVSDTFQDCNGCHVLNPTGNSGAAKPGFFGGDGRSSFENEPQHFKVPHLRNMYQKVGMFGMADVPFFNSRDDDSFLGDQVRGFGFLHDGSVDTMFRFHGADVFNQGTFNPGGIPDNASGDTTRRQLEAFMLAFDSNFKPIVGQQITRTSTNGATVDPRITLLIARANAGECDLIVKGNVVGIARGYLKVGATFTPDRASESALSDASLRALANTAGQELTYTCAPPASGVRMALDRDEDGFYDRDELDAGSDPADAGSVPGACGNGTQEGSEQCDGADLNGQTCGSLGFDGGSLSCNGSCQFNTSACYECGDGSIDAGEECDGGNLGGETCVSQGFGGGTLACNASCQFNTSGCSTCGNGNQEGSEQCDGADLNGASCVSQGFAGGTLTCNGSCLFNTSGCYDCGDGSIDVGEECDGANLGGETCVSRGYDAGTLACDGSCLFDETACTLITCGNGGIDAGEECDGVNLNGQTCTSQGYDGGTLGCGGNCQLITSGCYECGDGTINPGEQCDGANLGGETCSSQGFDGGMLACNGSCQLDTSACYECGDGNIDPGEQCDGSNLDGETCQTLGFDTGALACDPSCLFDVSDCAFAICGDAIVDPGEECDGANLAGESCETLGFDGGPLTCDACLFDTSACTTTRGAFNTKTLKASHLTDPPGAQALTIKSNSMDATGVVYNPLLEPLTVTVENMGSPVWQATIPASDPGWRLANDRLKWKADDVHPQGLKNLSIGISGQPFAVKVKAKDAAVAGAAGAGNLTVTLTVGIDVWSGATPACVTSGTSSTIKCR
jgi:DNA-binding beta-propeller fold protein YncE